jgi:ribonucleoside-diphosphate reductase alpha chain
VGFDVVIGNPPYVDIKELGQNDVKYFFEKYKTTSNRINLYSIFIEKVYDFSILDIENGHWGVINNIISHNCGEIPMNPYSSCILTSLNLYSYFDNPFTDKAEFDYKKFYEINYEAMRLADDLIDLEVEAIDKILDKIKNDPEDWSIKQREFDLWTNIKETATASRRTGLGFTALGDTLAALNVKYDSEEGLEIIESIMHYKMKSELDCTIDLSILRGNFIGWDNTKEFDFNSNDGGQSVYLKGENSWYQFIADIFPEQSDKMCLYGRRNLSFSTVAPTGTVSLMTQTTSGVEPLLMPYYTRRKKINPDNKESRIDFTDQNGDTWQEYFVLHPKFKDWYISNKEESGMFPSGYKNHPDEASKEELEHAFKKSPWYKSTANDIDWQQRVKIQSVIQKYITHSISSTVNLPNDVSEQEVSNIYMEAWKQGSKGITVYRDGSRSGVLVDSNTKSKEEFEYKDAPKRPKDLKAVAVPVRVKGQQYTVITGLYNDKPYEVFCIENLIKAEGTISKIKKGNYVFHNDNFEISITDNLTDEQAAITRLVSTSLRHGANIKFIVEQLHKTKGDITSFTTAISRVLSKYAGKLDIKGLLCQECGSDQIIMEEGCSKCLSCGSSKCG